MTVTEERSADARQAPQDPMPLRPREFLRWCWRQLTSMRTALLLLFLLALAAIPGSVVPQAAVDAQKTAQWKQAHATLTPIYQRLGLFDVYGSVWFAAIYLLLVVSLVGCIVPRCMVYWRALRAQPPAAPRRLDRLPAYLRVADDTGDAGDAPGDPEESLDRAERELRRRRFRVVRREGAVCAERGRLREAGNLVFHLAVLVVLAGFATGSLFGYRGGVIVVAGDGFSNSLSQYDEFRPGRLFDILDLNPFSFRIDDFRVKFIRQGREAGTAHEFSAGVTYRAEPGAPAHRTRLAVNHPLDIGGTKIYLISHGYAPHLTVRDGRGHIAYSGSTVFLPEDQSFRSFGVVKVPDAQDRHGKREQLGLQGELYPTYAFTPQMGPFSINPDAHNPVLSMLSYTGDLGLDSGQPQSVYALSMRHLTPLHKADGKPARLDIAEGRTVRLPDGRGSVTFDGMKRFVKLQVSRSPGDWVALLGTCLALLGLCGSLFVRPRRVWVRRTAGGLELGGLDRTSGGDPAAELALVAAALGGARPGGVPGGATGGPASDNRVRSEEDR